MFFFFYINNPSILAVWIQKKMNNTTLSSIEKQLLTRLSNSGGTTIVSGNVAYFGGQFFIKTENNWEPDPDNDLIKLKTDLTFGMYMYFVYVSHCMVFYINKNF